MSSLDILRATGERLYGSQWQAALARAIQRPGATKQGIQIRSVVWWLAGERGVPRWVPGACEELLRASAASNLELADTIKAAL